MKLTSAARSFLEKSFMPFIRIQNQLNRRIKSVKVLNTSCNDFWRWLLEFKKLPSHYCYEPHCAKLEKWLNILKKLNRYSSNTNKRELEDKEIMEMKQDFDAAYVALKNIIFYDNVLE